MSKSFNLRMAERTLREGDPLPIDLICGLMEEGIDVEELVKRIDLEKERGA